MKIPRFARDDIWWRMLPFTVQHPVPAHSNQRSLPIRTGETRRKGRPYLGNNP
jgi:hypothetical protein